MGGSGTETVLFPPQLSLEPYIKARLSLRKQGALAIVGGICRFFQVVVIRAAVVVGEIRLLLRQIRSVRERTGLVLGWRVLLRIRIRSEFAAIVRAVRAVTFRDSSFEACR